MLWCTWRCWCRFRIQKIYPTLPLPGLHWLANCTGMFRPSFFHLESYTCFRTSFISSTLFAKFFGWAQRYPVTHHYSLHPLISILLLPTQRQSQHVDRCSSFFYCSFCLPDIPFYALCFLWIHHLTTHLLLHWKLYYICMLLIAIWLYMHFAHLPVCRLNFLLQIFFIIIATNTSKVHFQLGPSFLIFLSLSLSSFAKVHSLLDRHSLRYVFNCLTSMYIN